MIGIVPYDYIHKSESGCKHGDHCQFIDTLRLVGRPVTSRRKVAEWVSCLTLKESVQLCCRPKITLREYLFYVNLECWDQNTPSIFPRALGTKSKFGKERVHRKELCKSVNLWLKEVEIARSFDELIYIAFNDREA